MKHAGFGMTYEIRNEEREMLFSFEYIEMMKREAEREWDEAQKIGVSVDLVEAAHNQLKFLAVIDRNRHLYESPSLDWAIYRYNAFWLPLLAKHVHTPLSRQPLVVPLDCEWIWHCHRLNPVRYMSDCLQLFGTLLDNRNVISSLHATSHTTTRQIWEDMYPHEPYDLQFNRPPMELGDPSPNPKFTTYDLLSAVNRQIPFTFQVSRSHMSNHLFLQEAVARYKGFLHLIATNKKNNIRRFCVPTYDIDLIWHSHQLHPDAYCKDLTKIMGKVLEHDDTDSDRTKGQKLDTGFSETTKQWEETFGLSYWKAGAMYRGPAPTPVTHTPFPFSVDGNKFDETNNKQTSIQFPAVQVVEVLLQFVEIKNLKEELKEKVFVSFSKKQPDKLFNTKRSLSILSKSGEKQAALFQCEPTGEMVFELIANVRSNMPITSSSKSLGSCSLSLEKYLASATKFSVNEWLSIVPVSSTESLEPILLHVSISFTIPEPAPQTYHLVRPRSLFKNSCLFPLLGSNKSQHAKSSTHVIDDEGNNVISLQMSKLSKEMKKINPDLLKEVYYITDSGETNTLANCVGNEWCLKGTYGTFKLCGSLGKNGHLFELIGHKMVKLFSGRRLEYEAKHCERQRAEQDFITAVEFSSDNPYGRAVALIDLTRGTFKAKDEWMLLPGITLTFILSVILKRKGFSASTARDDAEFLTNQLNTLSGNIGNKIEANEEIIKNVENLGHSIPKSGGCGSGCGSGCRNAVKSGGCGSGCGSGCGNAVKSGGGGCGSGCGGGCGSGCGNAVTTGGRGGGGCGSGCGGGCGSGCGSKLSSGGCGGCGAGCGGGCGNQLNSGGCGGCGSGGCGNSLPQGGDDSLNEVLKVEGTMGNEPVGVC